MYGDRFKKRLPKFLGKIEALSDTFIAEDKEFIKLDRRVREFLYALIASFMGLIERPDYFLKRYEKDYGLKGLGSIDDRIRAILLKLIGTRTSSEEVILDIVKSFGIEGEFYQDYKNYSFLLSLRSRKDFNVEALDEAIREVIPAHLAYKRQIAVVVDSYIGSTSLAGELIIISEPNPNDLIMDRDMTIRASNVSSYELIELRGEKNE